jgi:hypothetical protein
VVPRALAMAGYVLALTATLTVSGTAQGGGKPARGNPTPGTAQPDPPNPADRITLTGCVQAAPNRTAGPVDPNTPNNSRFVLAGAERQQIVPADTGGSDTAAKAASRSYRLEAIESQLSPFVGTKVQVSGEIKPAPGNERAAGSLTLLVEFVQKLAPSCS